ncbi:aldehyde dehydrogenase family protein [Faecalibacter bovis]|uniref:Aldehyde dehydrogenase n=1 Tax=Faecalibacter bovis TaxID=2898187 RepID=A0ABX7XBU9_9FLAO|nr:aldehyde dehydrogenase family protein [Faecalibacter bovis]QTV05396.1 aldehyde dehydrogenase family protein [Faecalibacter bovis]
MSDKNYPYIDLIYNQQVENKCVVQNLTIKQRIALLKKLEKEIIAHREEIVEALGKDFRKSKVETESTEIYPVLSEIRLFCKNLSEWSKSKSVSNNLVFFGSKAEIVNEPKGNCLIISPWNYPFQLALMHLIPCIAAGNTAIIKPSEFTAHTNSVLNKILGNVFDSNHVQLIYGEVEETKYILSKKFDHIHFTGSPNVGKIVMEAGAKHLSSVTLELGGKSPLIIGEDFDLKKAVSKAIWGKLINNGQTCIAPDYILIHEDKAQEFVDEFIKQMDKTFGSDPKNSEDLARMINTRNFNRVKDLIQNAIELGANCPYGNEYDGYELYIKPTILTNVPKDAEILKEEIFGPVFPIITYNSVENVINYVNSDEKPLALYIFSNNKELIENVTNHTSSGAVLVNDLLIHILHPNLPFGGLNHSGIGSSTGYFGFLDFSHQKPVLKVNQMFSLTKFLNYPYNSFTKKIINLMIKYL